ncbi:MAG: hypothetical protein AAFN92_13065, partial [Bacteroidota bacterium]
MSISYASLFTLQIQHDYFPNGICPALECVPTPKTATRLQALGVRTVKRASGIEAFYDEAKPLSDAEETAPFTFFLRPNDPLFHDYTELPPDATAFVPFPLGTELPNDAQLGDLGRYTVELTEQREFLLAFTARATIWSYHLIDQQANGNEQYDLLDGQTGVVVASTGDNPVLKVLPDGSEAIVLTTDTPIPLRQRPETSFTLRRHSGSEPKEITLPLPAANAQ